MLNKHGFTKTVNLYMFNIHEFYIITTLKEFLPVISGMY